MARESLSELPELIDWLTTTIEPLQGTQWQITLNSSGNVIEATARFVQSKNVNERGHTMTISKVVSAKFRTGRGRRTVFQADETGG